MKMLTGRRYVAVFSIFLQFVPVYGLGGNVYHCIDESGQSRFQDHLCDTAVSRPLEIQDIRLGNGGLRDAERRAAKKRSKRVKRYRKTAAKRDRKEQQERSCWQKRQKLEAVNRQLRRGYKRAQGEALRRRRADYEDYIKRFCS